MTESQPWTIGRLLNWTAEYLTENGSSSGRLDAEVLLSTALHCSRIDLYTRFEEEPGEMQLDRFREMVRCRAEGTPVAYLVGSREFYSLEFHVNHDVLIPRPETEYLVMRMLDLARAMRPAEEIKVKSEDAEESAAGDSDQAANDVEGEGSLSAEKAAEVSPLEIVDVGTGSGIIAICAAKHLPCARITAIDLSRSALSVARENVSRHGVGDRVTLRPGDLLTGLPADQRFDIIASNPPYVSEEEMTELAPEDFEPRGALVGGREGTEIIERLIPQAAERLNLGGHLLIELSPMIHDQVVQLIKAEPRLRFDETIRDASRLDRIVQATKVQ